MHGPSCLLKRFALFFLCSALLYPAAEGQKPDLTYYLPAVAYDETVPKPSEILGYEVGEWHVSHDQLVFYLRELARSSQRVALQVYGYTHEQRPLICLTITAPENQRRIQEIRQQRQRLADPTQSPLPALDALPAVVYMGYSIHGNEASGSNAALLVAYYLAAAKSAEVERLLQNTVVLLDPCFNPDGLQRFAAWVNSRRSKSLMPDPLHDEFQEPWPGGRTNHYWFDLNRDWLVTQQPESVGRLALFHEWKPNVLTDHHEMGTNTTFFFQPGVPSRVHPLTPALNQQLTARIAQYHARILNEKKILYYSEENYDDFYYGKGSSYPDVNGSIGILFEQASSRGSAQESSYGLLAFPYTVRNQVLTSLSTLQAVGDMRVELNKYLRNFYETALEEAKRDPLFGYAFSDTIAGRPVREFIRLLLRHRIQVLPILSDEPVSSGEPARAWAVPLEQPAYRLVKAIFERRTEFTDSVFYDISAWTLPDAFGLNWTPLRKEASPKRLGRPLEKEPDWPSVAVPEPTSDLYAYAVSAESYDLPRLLAALHRARVRVLLAQRPFQAEDRAFAAGTLLIPLDRQTLDAQAVRRHILQSGAEDIRVFALHSGLTPKGPDLGSAHFTAVRPPKVVLVTGRGANPAEVGEVWHLLDVRYGMPPLLLDAARMSQLDLSKYNTLILAGGNFSALPAEKVKQFVSNGGVLIAIGGAIRWLKNNGIANWEIRPAPRLENTGRRPYERMEEDARALSLPGAILEAKADLTHPICFGYGKSRMPLFVSGEVFLSPGENPYTTPLLFDESQPLLAGYLNRLHIPMVVGAAAVSVQSLGNGRIFGFCTNPNFRGFWYGTNRLFANAVFFGDIVRTGNRYTEGE